MSAGSIAKADRYIETARRFAAEAVAPHAAAWERDRRAPREAFEAAADAGLMGLLVPEELGGAGLDLFAMARIMEVLAAADLAFAFSLVVHNNLAGNIARNGAPHHHTAHLPDLIAGRRIGAFLLTEPQGGSDAANVQTTAKKTETGWRIDGEKAWVTSGSHADLLSIYAQTDPAAGHRGVACFLAAADAPGVERLPAYAMLGGHALGAGGFRFDGLELGEDAHFIPAGRGFAAAMEGIDLARVNVAYSACGMLRSGLDAAIAFVSQRSLFGTRNAEKQGIQWILADAASELEAASALAAKAGAALAAGDPDGTVLAAHAKKYATRVAFDRLNDCMQVMGAWGLTHDHPLARHMAGAKIAQYLDGANEIQNVVISRALFGRRG
ncbi:MAG: acyl-CoA dehydrogenase family protein [Rhodospirillaceae bacterium]|nr:acyl-CoA dehydrogenase family protein [Rhodospirillaceae bacterium]